MNKRYIIKVYGRVQGVFYRASTQHQAKKLSVFGWVRNEQDGAVKIDAEGSSESLEKFIEWCKKGPELAKVDRIEKQEMDELENYSDFVVRR